MSVLFAAASSEYISAASSPVQDDAMTFACWFYTADTTSTMNLINVGDSASNFRGWRLQCGGGTAGRLEAAKYNAGSGAARATSTVGYTASTWQHAVSVFSASNSRAVWLNNSEYTNATSRTTDAATYNRIGLGARLGSSAQEYFDGRIAVPAIWNIALDADDIGALYAGKHPLTIRRSNLVFFTEFIGVRTTEIDEIGGLTLTHTNTPSSAAHPRLSPRFAAPRLVVPQSSAASYIPNFVHHYKQMARG